VHTPDAGAFLNRYEYKFLLDEGFEVYSLSFPTETPQHATENDRFVKLPASRLQGKRIKFIGERKVRDFVIESIEEIQPDLIHCHLVSVCPAAVYEGIDANIPVIQTLHGPNLFCATSWGCYPDSGPCELGIGLKCYSRGCVPMSHALLYMNLRRRYWENMVRKVNVFHCPSRHIMNSAIRLGLENVEHISHGINEAFMDVERESPKGDPTAIFVGSLERCKGVDVLIDAMRIARRSVPNAKLLIAGKGEMQGELDQEVRDLGLDDHVTFLGHIPHETLLENYRTSDVFVMPSVWQEQFGLVGAEGMACGLPCIGSDIGGIPEWLRHGEWGRLVPPGHSEHLARALVFYLTHRADAFAQGLKGQAHARKAFHPNRYRLEIVGLIERLIDGNQ